MISVPLQAYLVSLALGVSLPLVVFAMLLRPMRHFLHAIFRAEAIERFWVRVVFLTLFIGSLSAAIGFHPDESIGHDFIALVFNLADQAESILNVMLLSMFAMFLPLLLSYTILHFGRDRDYERRSSGAGQGGSEAD